MRNLAFASLLAAAALIGACSAVDDFTKFTFVDGGGGPVDTDMGGLPGFGQACTDSCAVGADPTHPLTCFHMFGSRTVTGGMCTRTCNMGSPISCTNLGIGSADCVTVEGMDLCLPHCDASLGRNCRTNFSCCANRAVVNGAGDCAPPTTDLCR
ncbi:MAG: hypothetical protein JWM53_5895 [bacterium]|nr:hypothetical protein [bacterium]